MIITIIDNHFKQAVNSAFASEALRSAYLSEYAVWVGIISSVCVLLGINNIQRHLGIVISLILTPVLVLTAVVWIKFNPLSIESAFGL